MEKRGEKSIDLGKAVCEAPVEGRGAEGFSWEAALLGGLWCCWEFFASSRPQLSISCRGPLAPLPSSTLGPGDHPRLGSEGPPVHAHLIPAEDGQRLSHGFSVGQDEVQHPISIEVCHHTPCNNMACALPIGQGTPGAAEWGGAGPETVAATPALPFLSATSC